MNIKKFIPQFVVSGYHFCLALLGAIIYQFPSKKIKVIGVTGTKGKSTVVTLITRLLEEGGFRVAALSSINFKIDKKEWPNTLKMTMPGRLKLQKFLKTAVVFGCQYAVLEITSEGIKQHRHSFIDFEVAVFTNLAPEHIESHGSFEKYREAKGRLFQITKNTHIINLDDKNAEYFLQFSAKKKITYGIKNKEAEIKPERIKLEENKTLFTIHNSSFETHLLGEFNIYNSLAAICVGLSQGISLETCRRALKKVKEIPGRMEIVVKKPFTVIVDYAHTPDSLESIYKTLLDYKIASLKLICVLGSAGGGRDKWKRPKMGEIAARYCNQIILTNEDPYDDDPIQILNQIESGITKISKPILKILDRKEAIKKALNLAKPGDIVIITGKGCEPWMCVAGGHKIPWDDREIVSEQLRELKIKS